MPRFYKCRVKVGRKTVTMCVRREFAEEREFECDTEDPVCDELARNRFVNEEYILYFELESRS